jgi:hypothetical protein
LRRRDYVRPAFHWRDLSIGKKIKAGMNPDGIVYDEHSKLRYADWKRQSYLFRVIGQF